MLPTEGYSPAQFKSLRLTINGAPADVVVAATPIDLATLISIDKRAARARHEFVDSESPGLTAELQRLLAGCVER